MVDKRTLEFILTDQQEEMEGRTEEALCQRREESLIDIKSTQAQVVIGVRRSGKSTLCYQAMHNHSLKFAYADFEPVPLSSPCSGSSTVPGSALVTRFTISPLRS